MWDLGYNQALNLAACRNATLRKASGLSDEALKELLLRLNEAGITNRDVLSINARRMILVERFVRSLRKIR